MMYEHAQIQKLNPECPIKPDICNESIIIKNCDINGICNVTINLAKVDHNSESFNCVKIDWGDSIIQDVTSLMNEPTHLKKFTHIYVISPENPEIINIWTLVENNCNGQCTECTKILITPEKKTEIPMLYVAVGAGILGLVMILKK